MLTFMALDSSTVHSDARNSYGVLFCVEKVITGYACFGISDSSAEHEFTFPFHNVGSILLV